jgi:hypothetical protein
MLRFARYIGIDYSGAETANSRLSALQVFKATPDQEPVRVDSGYPKSAKWTRKELAHWLAEQLACEQPLLVGIDHAFSFPMRYLDRYQLNDWDQFLDDFHHYWPTDRDNTYVDFIREDNPPRQGTVSDGLRLTEKWTSSAKCVFQFDCQGSVAKSTYAGIPWLHFLRHLAALHGRVHFWPFDGWMPPAGVSVVAEVYPSIFRKRCTPANRSPDEHDAYAVALWMSEMVYRDALNRYLTPPLTVNEQRIACREGWILGVT